MARRPGQEGGVTLGPRERRILGWIVALVLVVGIAIVVGVLGGNGDGDPIAPAGSVAPSGAAALPITFGTEIDPETGEVASNAQTAQFTSADQFAYSVMPAGEVPTTVYVEVERIGGGANEIVQAATPDGEQQVTQGRPAIAFTAPAARLLEVFGPGEYRMRMFVDPTAAPIAEGTFTLVGDGASPATSP
jgi:hypothetical protein